MRAFLIAPLLAAGAAQTPPPPSTTGLGGPVIPGVCLLSREAVFANAKVGIAALARLKVLTDQAQAEVEVQRKPIDTDTKAFQAESQKLTPDQRTTRAQALSERLQRLQTFTAQRSREIEATRTKAMQQISAQVQPVVIAIYKQRSCGLLLDRNGVISGNFTNDLTPDVVRALDAKITTITFEREVLPPAAPTPR